jgi:hypothetical protein
MSARKGELMEEMGLSEESSEEDEENEDEDGGRGRGKSASRESTHRSR